MDTRKIATEYRTAKWAQLMQSKHEAGQSIDEFCEDKGISKNVYFYWQRKLRETVCKELAVTTGESAAAPNGWAKLAIADKGSESGQLTVEVGGCRVTVKHEADIELLTKVCRALKSL